MTKEEIMDLSMEEIETRKAEIRAEIEQAGDQAALDAIDEEMNIIEERIAQIKEEVETRKADMGKVADGLGKEIEKHVEERKMSDIEVRNSEAYINAYANYLKTGKADECRALLTENVSGTVPVPTYVEDRIRTAWDRVELMGLVRKTYIPGNLNVGFELSADPAYVHTEGSAAKVKTIGQGVLGQGAVIGIKGFNFGLCFSRSLGIGGSGSIAAAGCECRNDHQCCEHKGGTADHLLFHDDILFSFFLRSIKY